MAKKQKEKGEKMITTRSWFAGIRAVLITVFVFSCIPAAMVAAEGEEKVSAEKQKLYDLFEKKLTNVKFTGNFTILGSEQAKLPKESYTIKSVKKLPQGEYWLFTARIQYGGQDVTLPIALEVQWAGTTPVITLTNVLIPGLGTFSSRVVIYKNKYAGTWTHGDVGGHLFGTIQPNKESQPPAEKKEPPKE